MAEPCRISEEETRRLLLSSQAGDFQARERLCAAHLGLVGSIVGRFSLCGKEQDDLFQVGCLGLLKAIARFDPSYPVCFSTYAVPVILGEVRCYLREDGPLKVSRQLKERAQRLRRCQQEVYQQTGKEPGIGQMAALCQISREEAVAALEAVRPPVSLQAPRGGAAGEGMELGEALRSELEIGDELLDRLTVLRGLESLPERLAHILRSRYFAERTQKDLAEELGVSQVQISRLERKALAMLKEVIQEI